MAPDIKVLILFALSVSLVSFIAMKPASASELDLLDIGGEAPASECLLALAGGGATQAEQSAPSSMTITGPEEITKSGSAQFAVSGAPEDEDVVWSAYGNFGSAGGISNSGALALGSDACGAVKVAASSQGIVATKEVRVKDGGRWVTVESCLTPCDFSYCPASAVCNYIEGRYQYTTATKACCAPCGNCDPGCCGSESVFCTSYWSTAACGPSKRYVRSSKKEEWQCPACKGNTNKDDDRCNGQACNSVGSCQNALDCNDTDPAIYPGAPEICDGKDNDCDGEFDEGCAPGDGDGGGGGCTPEAEICDGVDNDCDNEVDEGVVDLRVSPSEVAPQKTSGNTKADVIATLHSPAASGGCSIALEVDTDAHLKSGGHDHHGPNDGRPKGTLGDYRITFLAGEAEKSVKYTSSEFAGTETIRGTVSGSGDKAEADITVKVPGLAALNGSHYDLKCNVYSCAGYKHTDFYNVAPWVGYRFSYTALKYHQKYPADKKLIVNDGSLKWGGLYDFKNTWRPPHSTHRIGTDIDVRSKDIPVKNRPEFVKTVCRELVYPKLEYPGTVNEHYHLYFKPYNNAIKKFCK